MSNTTENNKRIAKNTLLLYFRMLFTIIIGLYTSRIVLQTLGVNDYGIYNVVGGIVAMMSFLNAAMTQASQRFIAFELGRQNIQKLKEVFGTSVSIHLVISSIIFIIAETIGLWFLNTHMNIENERMVAANWVYQCSIFTFICTIISVPYNACIVAHEKMKAFAYISILETFLKLIIVYLLLIVKTDKLIAYAILLASVSLIIRIVYGIYCKKQFTECTYHFLFKRSLFKKMFSFACWSLIGSLGFSSKDQAANIILNLFCGTAINAARGVALQVNGIISNFSNNFIMALNPQITKQYAGGNITESIQLVYTGCRYSFYLLAIITIPIMINIDYLLHLWLSTVPIYTSQFLQLALVSALIASMASPLVTAIQATGNIKAFQLSICIIMLFELPLTYLTLKLKYEPYMVMMPTIFVTLIGLLARIYLLKRLIKLYSLRFFTINIVLKNICIACICYFISKYIHNCFTINFINFIITSLISFIITSVGIISFGISSKERIFLYNRIKSFYKK